jgi:hypothetical protein
MQISDSMTLHVERVVPGFVDPVIDDNYISRPRQLQFPTSVFHCSVSFLDESRREIAL